MSDVQSQMLNDWLPEATRCLSPNVNQRPHNVTVDLLVIHNISLPPGEFGGGFVQQFFTNCLDSTIHPYFDTIKNTQVSAHVFIERNGAVTQCAPFSARAWHAGVSVFNGVENCNDYSIGIELEGCDDIAYTDAQYESLVKVTQAIQTLFPAITAERMVGHSQIAPTRKTDPGPAFNWLRFHHMLGGK